MKAIKVDVSEREWSKVTPFIAFVSDENVVVYRLSRTSFLVVTSHEAAMECIINLMKWRFEDEIGIAEITAIR